jgi:DNA polymerase-3 subunit gamma/tau
MAYQVLARKWRPRNFPEMVGQAHVLRALSNALENNRLHHAYLFTGTRGVGKTTIARILAKSLNCEKGNSVTAYPCGECAACREIDEGRFVDLIEVDAASRTKVEDTRDLLDNVQYAPTRGRYKVYLIDEVHMLSSHSFNALLKTLEEPPPHVKFLLATTDPQKLPPTILSRCLQFNLKRLPLDEIIAHLTKILKSEEISYDIPALRLLAVGADGSLRDALSLLDQAIAYGAGKVSKDDVSSMLGSLDQNSVLKLVQVLIANDASGMLQQVAQLAEQNPDFFALLGDIISLLQQIALAQVVPSSIDINEADGETILQLAEQASPEDVQLFYQIALVGRRDLPLAPEPRGGFEMVMLRMLAFRPDSVTLSYSPPKQVQSVELARNVVPEKPVIPSSDNSSNTDVSNVNLDDWESIVGSLGLGALVKQLAIKCSLEQRKNDVWYFTLPPEHGFLLKEDRKKQIELALQKQYGASQKVLIHVEHSENKTPVVKQQHLEDEPQKYGVNQIEKDPFVVYMKENCDAKVIS